MTNCNKAQQIQQLNDDYKLFFNPNEYVFGFGNYNCKLMLIGEAPGKDEVLQGKPFVGSAGKILTNLLKSISIDRQDVYITNAIKYRLSQPGKRPNTFRNRPAKKSEIVTSSSFLKREIAILQPKLIVTLGNVPLSSIVGNNTNIGDCHGVQIYAIIIDTPQIIFPLYHPASLIYNKLLETAYNNDIQFLQKIMKTL